MRGTVAKLLRKAAGGEFLTKNRYAPRLTRRTIVRYTKYGPVYRTILLPVTLRDDNPRRVYKNLKKWYKEIRIGGA